MRQKKNHGAANAATVASNSDLLGGNRFEHNPSFLKFQDSFRHIHGLGPRVTAEFLAELLGDDGDLIADAELLLERYASLTPAMVHMVVGRLS